MADPTVIECAGQCTVTVVHEFALPILNLTVEQGEQITWAVCLVWATAWAIRQVVSALNSAGSDEKES